MTREIQSEFWKNYEEQLRQEARNISNETNPLAEIKYTNFTSKREFGKKRRKPVEIELIETTDGRMHSIKNDWAPKLDELAATTPGYEDNPTGLLEDLRRRR